MKPAEAYLKPLYLLAIFLLFSCEKTETKVSALKKEEKQIFLSPSTQKAIYTYKNKDGEVFHEEKPSAKYGETGDIIVTPLFLSPQQRNSTKTIFLANNDSLLKEDKVLLRQVSRIDFEQNLKIENFKIALDQDYKGIVLYKTSWCGACDQAIDFMKKEKLDFREFDIEADEDAKRRMLAILSSNKMQFRGVPVISIEGKVISGFDPGWIKGQLK